MPIVYSNRHTKTYRNGVRYSLLFFRNNKICTCTLCCNCLSFIYLNSHELKIVQNLISKNLKKHNFQQSRKITISLNGVETHLPVSAVLRRFRRDTTETTDSVRARKTAIQPPVAWTFCSKWTPNLQHRKRGSGGSTGSVKSNVTNRPATEQQLQVSSLSKITISITNISGPNTTTPQSIVSS